MKKIDFNRGWRFEKIGKHGVTTVNLPHDAMLSEPRSDKASSGSAGGFFAGGAYQYKKILSVDRQKTEQAFVLEFEGVYQNAQVLLNNETLCEHPYGYSNFFVDLSGKLHEGDNEITVIADNRKTPNSRWYSGSGIYREVHLYQAERERICPEGIRIRTESADSIHVQLETKDAGACRAIITVYDEDMPIAEAEGFDVTISIPDAKVWSAESPFLYRLKASLIKPDGTVADTDETRFGIRTLAWGEHGFVVNGERVKLRGSCIHHDNGILGACDFRDAEYRRIQRLKEAGFNAVRSAHNPISKAMLDACDELGMYVMDEAFDMWSIHKNPYDYAGSFNEWWKQDLGAMIHKDFSHPSVVMYSIGNEISELGLPEGRAQAKELTDFCHHLDQSRPVTAGINLALAQMAQFSAKRKKKDSAPMAGEEGKDETKNVPTSAFFNMLMNHLGGQMDKVSARKAACRIADELSDILDLPGYNYASSRYAIDAKQRPHQATVGSETLPDSLYRNWHLVQSIPTMIGDFMWTGWDYLGESGIGTVRYIDRKKKKDTEPGLIISGGPGIIDICGNARPEVGWSRLIWGLDQKPVIGVCPYTHANEFRTQRIWRTRDTVASWSWNGCEGKKSDVYVYAAAPKVELIINGKSLGTKKTKEYTAIFRKVAYEPGRIAAIARSADGNETGRCEMLTGERETKIVLLPEKTELRADGQDLCFLNIRLAGADGIVKSACDQKLKIEVSGAGSLQGYGSARPCMAEDFISDIHTTFYGQSLAVIRAGYETGTIQVTVSGEGLENACCQLYVHKP